METAFAGKPFATLCVAPGKGDQGPMAQLKSCGRADCSKRGVTSLGEERLCFDHFCGQCYELLEQADRRRVFRSHGGIACAELAFRLDECARRALEISLSQIELNNLDRARLLDIVLWSRDLTGPMRPWRGPDSEGRGEQSKSEILEGAIGSGRVS